MELALVLFFVALGGCGVGLALLARHRLAVLRRLNHLLEQRAEQATAELKAAQADARVQAARATSALIARTEFLTSMSHELRTPLNAVVGFADLLIMNEGVEPLTHRQRQGVEEIRKGGTRLTTLVDEVLELIELESGRAALVPERVDPTLLVRQVCESLAPLAAAARIELKQPPLVAGLLAMGDRARLKQVLTALIQNAIQYNRDDGVVLIEARQSESQVQICVRDTGLGVSPEHLEDVFEPFNRGGREASNVAGTGIGLAVARKLIEAMQGSLSVESEEGRGASFIISLPAADATAQPVVASPVPQKALGEATLLYIEDNASNIALMKHVISAIGGLQLHVAETGLQGLALARDLQPDAIILDINLPGMDGFQVMERLGQEPLTRDLPVIALSASASKSDLQKGRRAGFVEYLTKPLNIPLLVECLASVLPPVQEEKRPMPDAHGLAKRLAGDGAA